MNDYDVSSIFKEMEDYLLSSMSRNMQRHTNWENDEGFQWEMWQVKQLEALNEYRKQNKKYVNDQSSIVKAQIDQLLRQSNDHGGMQQEIKILEAIKKGFKPGRTPKGIKGSFFKLNERKLNALIKSVNSDMDKALHATLRMVNDEYRKTIHKAQMFANTGTFTTDQAIDMATKDFLAKGINCIEYKDGKRVNIVSYAEMAIRTASKRAYLQGEGSKRDEWGIHTVLVSRYGACSETCLPWQGKVYIDDVWSGGTAEEAEKMGYPLLSTAIAGGLFHPNCKHTMTTFFQGISTVPTAVDVKGTKENSNLVATQRYNERMIRKYKRLQKGSLSEDNKAMYTKKVREWQSKNNRLINEHPEMHRDYKRESLRGVNSLDYGFSKTPKAEEKTDVQNTIKNINDLGTKKMIEAYEYKRNHHNLNLTSADSFVNGSNKILSVDYGNIDVASAKGFNDTISKLVDEYETPLQKISIMGKEQAIISKDVPALTSNNYSVYSSEMKINPIILKDNKKYLERTKASIKRGQFPDIPDELVEMYVPMHEFAHTLISTQESIPKSTNWAKMDFKNIKEGKKEITSLYQEYMNEMKILNDEKKALYSKFYDVTISKDEIERLKTVEKRIKSIKISDYAATNADEFFAEGFVDAKIGKNPSKYSDNILKTVDNYLRKEISPMDDDGLDIPFKNKKVLKHNEIPYNKVNHIFTNGRYELDKSMMMEAKEYSLSNGIKVYTPNNINTDKQPITVNQINEVLSDFPNEIIKNIDEIEIVDYQNPQDTIISKTYNKKDFVSAAIGGDRKITFFPSLNNKKVEQIRTIMYHESGHILDDEFKKSTGIAISESEDYKNAMAFDEKTSGSHYISKYAENTKSTREDVADSVRMFCTDKEVFRKAYPARHKFIKEWFQWIKRK